MRFFIAILISLVWINCVKAQAIKVAILDFENTSGKADYDALGKSMSNMLITDLQNNIHPRKVEFYERDQINKLLKEQVLQKGENFDSKTAVEFGKMSGVNYVFLGSIFVLNGNINITAKLVDVKSSKILISQGIDGSIDSFLHLKSQLAYALANALNNPIVLDSKYKDLGTSLATINQYAKLLTSIDSGDIDKAEELRKVFEETNPEFKYFLDLKSDIELLKGQVKKNTEDIEVLNSSGGRVINANNLPELMTNLTNPLSTYEDRKKIMTDILKNEPIKIINLLGEFTHICNQPSGLEYLLSFDNKGKPSPRTLDFHINDFNFMNSLFMDSSINKESLSHYIYYYLRNFCNFKIIDPKVNSSAIILAEQLQVYNNKNNIHAYNIDYLGGGYYGLIFKNDLDLSIDHLITLLKSLN